MKIPTVNNPKILDCSHTTAIITKAQSRNKILKSVAGSNGGKDKKMVLVTYKTAAGQV